MHKVKYVIKALLSPHLSFKNGESKTTEENRMNVQYECSRGWNSIQSKLIQNKTELITEINAKNFTFEITIPSTNLDARDVACVVGSFGQVCCVQHKMSVN